ncbi:MAG: hypothetical protein HC927_02025 [Deltaproteobacteria bacterium]|nr:hypothetical protein [Deltaproteobacteria bacterium]
MLVSKRVPVVLALLSCVAAGCVEPEPEPLDNGENAGDFGECVNTPTVLASVDEVSALGFSAADVLAFADGEHGSPLFWRAPDSEFGVEYGPESGEGSLTVSIAHSGGEIRFIDSEPKEGNLGEGDFDDDCQDRLEIDVMAQINTAGGALAESLPVTLKASSDLLAQFDAEIPVEDLAGSMTVTALDPDFTVGPVALHVGVSSFGLNGSISGSVTVEGDGFAAAGFFQYAAFPSEEPRCGSGELLIPFDTALEGFSAADALALINQPWISQLTWQGGEPVELELSAAHDGAEVCASVTPGFGTLGSLRFGAELMLTTGDGVVQAAFPITVTAEPNEMGALGQVHAWHEAPYGNLVDVSEFAERFGEFGVDVSDYDVAGIEFSGAFAPSDLPGSADGSLAVLGGILPNCSDEPGAPCEGIDVTELARAEWGNTGVEP